MYTMRSEVFLVLNTKNVILYILSVFLSLPSPLPPPFFCLLHHTYLPASFYSALSYAPTFHPHISKLLCFLFLVSHCALTSSSTLCFFTIPVPFKDPLNCHFHGFFTLSSAASIILLTSISFLSHFLPTNIVFTLLSFSQLLPLLLHFSPHLSSHSKIMH